MIGDIPFAAVRPPENILFVCKLNPVTADEDLELIFSRFGKILSCEVVRDKKSGDSLQYAFIEFDEQDSAEQVSRASGQRRGQRGGRYASESGRMASRAGGRRSARQVHPCVTLCRKLDCTQKLSSLHHNSYILYPSPTHQISNSNFLPLRPLADR